MTGAWTRLRWRLRTRRVWMAPQSPLSVAEMDALAGLTETWSDKAATRRVAAAERINEETAYLMRRGRGWQ